MLPRFSNFGCVVFSILADAVVVPVVINALKASIHSTRYFRSQVDCPNDLSMPSQDLLAIKRRSFLGRATEPMVKNRLVASLAENWAHSAPSSHCSSTGLHLISGEAYVRIRHGSESGAQRLLCCYHPRRG